MDIWRPKTRAAPSRYPVMQSNLVWLLAALGLRRCSKWVPSPHIIPTYLSSFGHLLYFLSCNVHREPGSLEVIIHVMLGIQSLAWQLVATLYSWTLFNISELKRSSIIAHIWFPDCSRYSQKQRRQDWNLIAVCEPNWKRHSLSKRVGGNAQWWAWKVRTRRVSSSSSSSFSFSSATAVC